MTITTVSSPNDAMTGWQTAGAYGRASYFSTFACKNTFFLYKRPDFGWC
jgi:hypothetical protein